MKYLTKRIDKIASTLEEKGLLNEAEQLDVISNTLEQISGDVQKDIVEQNNKMFYHPLKRILKPFPQLLQNGKFVPSGIDSEAADIPGIEDTISFEFEAPNKVEMEIFVAGPDDLRIKPSRSISDGQPLTEKQLVDAIKTVRLF